MLLNLKDYFDYFCPGKEISIYKLRNISLLNYIRNHYIDTLPYSSR